METVRIEIWHDSTSDPEAPTWCVSACREDGDEVECLATADTLVDAIEIGRRKAEAREVPLCHRYTDGTLTTI